MLLVCTVRTEYTVCHIGRKLLVNNYTGNANPPPPAVFRPAGGERSGQDVHVPHAHRGHVHHPRTGFPPPAQAGRPSPAPSSL